ncbi:MAG: hypothetical protein ACO2PP_19385, partial [Thermocrinis sp.]|uniref:hypothetical protein n=1 Tax=Thermocrinis sp. TaxID=2024383 RepID=UPI003BFC6EA1
LTALPSPIWDGDRVFEAPCGPMVYPVKGKDIALPNLFGGTVLARRVEYMEVKASKRLSSSIQVEVSEKGLLDCIGLVCGGQVLAVVGRGSSPKRTLVVLEPQGLKDPAVFETLSDLLLREGFERVEVSGHLRLGGESEFEVVVNGRVVPAEDVFPHEEGFEPPVRAEAGVLKVEPDLADTPEEYLENFYALIRGIDCALSTKGKVYPIVASLCFGSQDKAARNVLRVFAQDIVRALDDFVGRPLLPTYGKACWEEKLAGLGNYRLAGYGLAYRVPASIYAERETLRVVYKLAKNLLETLLKEGEVSYRLGGGLPLREEYLRFLSEEEADLFLSFPERYRGGEKFVPVEVLSNV